MERLVDSIVSLDEKLFFILNGAHCNALDPVMKLFSNIPVWIPLYVLIAIGFFYKKDWRPGLVALSGLLLTFLLTDQISSNIIKDTVQRLRPSHIPEWEGTIRLLESKGGLYSFVSSHAANTFGLACFTSLIFRKRWYSILICCWAILVSYSRIYVGKHFPLDVICGMLLGAVVGWLVYLLYKKIITRFLSSRTCAAS